MKQDLSFKFYISWYFLPAILLGLILGFTHTVLPSFSIFDSLSKLDFLYLLIFIGSILFTLIYFPVITIKKLNIKPSYKFLLAVSGYATILILLGVWGIVANSKDKQFDDFNDSIIGKEQKPIIVNFPGK